MLPRIVILDFGIEVRLLRFGIVGIALMYVLGIVLIIGIHGPFEPHSGRSQLGHRRSAVRHAEASGHWCRALAVRLITIRCY